MNRSINRAAAFAALVLLTAGSLLAAPPEGVVNVNEADRAQLQLLPRVGPSLADRIVSFREENGRFQSPEDLLLVSGIGEKTFELLEPFIAVAGETTLTEKVRVSDLDTSADTAG